MPDAKVQAAIANWAPRFIAQGIDYNDFVRTSSQIERWGEWLDAWCGLGDMHEGMAREVEAKGRLQTAGEAHVRAALCYHFAKFVWLEDLAKHRAASDKSVASLYAAHRCLDSRAEWLRFLLKVPPWSGTCADLQSLSTHPWFCCFQVWIRRKRSSFIGKKSSWCGGWRPFPLMVRGRAKPVITHTSDRIMSLRSQSRWILYPNGTTWICHAWQQLV